MSVSAYPFLANPPSKRPKHRPLPISTAPRWTPPGRSPSFRRRRSSTTCSTPSVYTPSPKTPKSPPSHAHAVFGSHSYARRPAPTPASPAPVSPKRSPRRRPSPPSTPRARGPQTPSSTPKTPKLAKIRSFTNLRGAPPVPSVPTMSSHTRSASQATLTTVTGAKPSSKRAKRSATPAKNSQAFQKYRPMPFIQQMQILQFLEGGTLESHIQRHHQEAGLGKTAKNNNFASMAPSSTVRDDPNVCGYAFTDERGMIWFDEEEEWEFACLIPKVERERERGPKIKRMFGRGKAREGEEEEWEQFRGESTEEEEGVGSGAEESEPEWDGDDLASFGGDVASRRPQQSVLKMPKEKKDKGRRRRRSLKGASGSKPHSPTASSRRPATSGSGSKSLKQEFLATSFTPSPAPPSPKRSSPKSRPPAAALNNTSRFGLFSKSQPKPQGQGQRSRSASAFHIPSASLSVPSFNAKKAPYSTNNSVTSFHSHTQATADQVQWNWTEMPGSKAVGPNNSSPGRSSTAGSGSRPSTDSVAPPMKAARRLGIEVEGGVGVMVPMMKEEKKKGWWRK
ncbi:hypothetical protein M422DRAFT_34934 [Sphaerobolus stellatus SS14]|uniref:Unplaced genomic scaffold SPHSTscaffold_120, whole genome shotgun sequence n=1 Tax=Sphaerobolus stellatus (strain SS14) TaxID=990650 RepID=A0A0C9UZU6_SPHS4|nr:hypothetical protein M422DRAFT_34934 [Sphaerobolus stellatus SS14]